MRHISIDLTTENTRMHNGKFVGYIGEHNASELLITVPQTMIDESEYCVVFFQSGPQTFRSRRIYADSDTASAYRVDNCIHCLLGGYLTREAILGVQVECYRIGDDGNPELISKSPFASRLILKQSPNGYPGFGYDGSYEDMQRAIDNTHSHTNTVLLEKIGENEVGHFTYNGREISGEGISAYSSFSELPDDAAEGSMAYVENDEHHGEVDSIALQTDYASVGVIETPSTDALDNYPQVLYGGTYSGESFSPLTIYATRSGTEECFGLFQIIHIPGMASLFMATGIEDDRITAAYVPGGISEVSGQPTYVYNFVEGFDASLMTGASEPQICPVGWYKLTQHHENYRPEYGSLVYDYASLVEPILFSDTPLKFDFHCCRFNYSINENDGFTVNEEQLSILLSHVFSASNQASHEKGLYVREDNEWLPFKNGKVEVVSSRLMLPHDASEGNFAIVDRSSNIFRDSSGVWVSTDSNWTKLTVNPCLNNSCRLYDVSIAAVYGHYSTVENLNQFTPQAGVGFELVTNIENNYVLLSVSLSNHTTNRNHYIYSWNNQTIAFDADSDLGNSGGISIPLQVGWNRVLLNYSTGEYNGVTHITNPDDLPTLSVETANGENNYFYHFTSCTSEWFQNGFRQNYIGDTPFYQSDNAEGLWGFSEGRWKKLENNLVYTYEYEGE